MNGRIVALAAALTLVVGAGCHTNKKKTADRAETSTAKQQEPDRMEQAGEDVAQATRDAADATLEETERAQERVFGEGETLPPEPGVDMPEMGEETARPGDDTRTLGDAGRTADENADRAAEAINETYDEARARLGQKKDETEEEVERQAEKTAENVEEEKDRTAEKLDETGENLEESAAAMDGKIVMAKVDSVDRKDERVRFRIEEDVDEIRLQSGKEIDVPFADLQFLTGMTQEEALKNLEDGQDIKVKVLGVGDAMRIVEIDLQAGTEDRKHHEMDTNEKKY